MVLCLLLTLQGCALLAGDKTTDKQRQGAVANIQLGIDAMQRDALAAAKQKLEKALELDPEQARAHWVYAVLQERVGEPVKAERHFLRAIKLDPQDTTALLNYGNFLCRQEQIDKALKVYERAASDPYDPAPEQAYYNAGLCLVNTGQLERAEGFLRRALQRNPQLAQALYLMAVVSYGQGNFMQTRAYLQRYSERYDPIPETLKLCVLAERKLGNTAAAESCREQLLTDFPDSEAAAELNQVSP